MAKPFGRQLPFLPAKKSFLSCFFVCFVGNFFSFHSSFRLPRLPGETVA